MANPYEVRVPNALEALMAGEHGYDSMRKIVQERELSEARRNAAQVYSSNPQAALAQLMGVGDLQGAHIYNQMYQQSPQAVAAMERAKQGVIKEFTPNTSNIKLPDGSEVTVEKGPPSAANPSGYRLPTITGMQQNTSTPVPPGVDPKAWRIELAKKIADQEAANLQSATQLKNYMPHVDRAMAAYEKLGNMNAIGPVAASAPNRMVAGALHGTMLGDVNNWSTAEATRQEYEAAKSQLELLQAQISLKGQGAVSDAERRLLAITLPRLDAADPKTGLETLRVIRSVMGKVISDADAGALRRAQSRPQQPQSVGSPNASQAAPTNKAITKAEYDALPSGSTFTAPDGSKRVKP